MGTTYHIKISEEVPATTADLLRKDIEKLLEDVNQSFSTYIETSEVSTFNQYDGVDDREKSAEFITVLSEALRISDITKGAYDITVGPLVNLWGFGPRFTADNVPDQKAIDQASLNVGYKNIVVDVKSNTLKKIKSAIYIDFSSIAKGYGVDKVAELLYAKGLKNFMVEIGGEMQLKGANPQGDKWRIAVEKPDSSSRSIHQVINVTDMAVATSGDYRNYFEKDGVKFSHTIDPVTGYPVQQSLASVTVMSKSCMTADAWATAFMVLGIKKGYDLAIENNLAVLFLVKDGKNIKELKTPEFQAIIKEYTS
jgi:thiamine biosynthesis lipoprotein